MEEQQRVVSLTNLETGERVEHILEEESRAGRSATQKARTRFSDGYGIVFYHGMTRLARDRRITGSMHRVIAALMLRAPITGEPFRSDPHATGAITGMSARTVAKLYVDLVGLDLITRPRYGHLAFNPRYFWRGPAEAREQALADRIASAYGAEGDSTTEEGANA